MPLPVAAQCDAVIKRVASLTQQQIVATAKAANAKVMATPPKPLRMTRHVDGVLDAPEEAVKPGGVIVYDYDRLDLVVQFALDTLRQLSPVESGDYASSHVIMLNGTVVDNVSGWKPGDEITISNSQPYTRKIEIGDKGYRAHGHVYEKSAHVVSRQYGNMASVSFTYRAAPPGAIQGWAARTKLSRKGSVRNRAEWLVNQPTLVIRENS